MAVKTYTVNGAGQRYSYEIPFGNTPDNKNGGISKPGGTLISSSSTVRIGCDQSDVNDYYQGATAIIGRFSFTTSTETASKIELKKIEWTGRFGQIYAAGNNPISQPKCLITKNPLPADYLNIWAQGTNITISNTNASAENVIIYSENFSTTNQSLESNTTYYIFVFDTYNYPNGVGTRYFDTSNGSLIVTTEVETYTNIGKPSNIKATASYAKPGGSLTVAWTEAANGTNNPVKNYTLTWQVGSYSKTITEITTTSCTITMPDDQAIRGFSISCAVQAIPTQSGYGSEAVTSNAIAKINQLPLAPTVASSQTIVPSTGGSVKFTLSGSDPDGQNISFMCNGALFTNGSTIKITETTTFNFQTNDGLENGPATEITITKNTQPTFSVSVSGSTIAPSIEISATETAGLSNTYTCTLVYGTITKNIETNKTGTFSINDIRSYGIPPKTNYSFTIVRNDGIETYSKSGIGANQLITPECPIYIHGNHGSGNWIEELEGYFDSALIPTFSNVESLDRVKITINNKEFIFVLHKGNSNYYFELNDQALNTFARGIPTTMKVVFGYGDLFFPAYTVSNPLSFTRIINGADALPNLVLYNFNLFKDTPTLTFRDVYNSNYKLYGFATSPLDENATQTLQVSFNQTESLSINFNSANSVTSDNEILYQLDGQEIYNRLANILEHEKAHAISATVSFENDLGGTVSKTVSTVVDCGIDIKSVDAPNLLAQDEEISNWEYLLQGMTIKNNSFSYEAYSENLYAQIYVSRDNGKTWIAYKQIAGTTTDTLNYNNPCSFNFNSSELTSIGSTLIDYTPQFKIKLFTSKKIEVIEEEIALNKTITVKALIAPAINIVSGTYNDGKITIKYQFIDNNEITSESTVKLCIGAEEKGEWIISADQVIIQDYTFSDKIESVLVYLEGIVTATTTATDSTYSVFVTTKTSAYTIFNIQPTVSYRKNRLGINCSIDGENNTEYVIKIASSGSSQASEIALVSKTNATRIINIEDGTLINFIIDCGTW